MGVLCRGQAEAGKADMQKKIEELENDKQELQVSVKRLKSRCDEIEKVGAEALDVEVSCKSEKTLLNGTVSIAGGNEI